MTRATPAATFPRRRAAILLGVALVASSCAGGPATTHDALTAGAEPLRSHFNRDAGHTRIVLLAAPT